MTTPPLDCAETFRRLDDYLDRELSADEIAAVETHLGGCAECADEFTVERELLLRIREKLARQHAPPGLIAKISARLAAE